MPIGAIEYHSSSTGEWMSWPPPPNEEDGQRFIGTPNGDFEFMYSQVPGASWTAPRLENARQWIQTNILDHRIPRISLPPSHPYVIDGDPTQEWLFWDGTDVVERLVVIDALTVVTVEGVEVPRAELRRVSRPYIFTDGEL